MMEKKWNWVKKGKIFESDDSFSWSQTHTQLPVPCLINKDTLRIYYSSRDSESRSRISYVDVNPDNPSEVLYMHPEPVMDIGELGTFDDVGTIAAHMLKVSDQLYLYYNGYNLSLIHI